MNRNQLHIQIESLLEKMTANNASLKGHEGKFSQLETDLLRKQCIELYDAINQLHLNNMMDKTPKPVVEEITKKEPETVKEEIKINVEPIKEDIKEEPKPEKEESKIIAKQTQPVSDTPKFVPIVEKPPVVIEPPKKQAEEKSVLDKINETKEKTTLHDSISLKKEEQELTHRFANSKIAKIKDAIDISKRFEIQSNLFGGDSNAYNISMSELEIAGDKVSALELYDRFALRYHWKEKDELALELKSFIYRKY